MNSTVEKGSLSVSMENIFPLIKKWLYSEKDIFIRELVANGLDAITKFKTVVMRGDATSSDEYRIDVKIDKDAKQISVSDNGIGMTEDEVKRFINEVAFSGAAEFMEKYKELSSENEIVGHFGLGFYSSFMVASNVAIKTKSFKDAPAILWNCDGSPEFTLSESDRTERGTEVILTVTDEEKEFLEESRLEYILKNYCSFVPVPLYLNGKQINTQKPIWLSPASELKDEDYLAFYRYLYPYEEDPVFWIQLNTEFPVRAKGVFYFPHIHTGFLEQENTKGNIRFYCNQMFVSDNLKGLLPDFLIRLRGVFDSPDLPLNVSRSYLQHDPAMLKLSAHITKKAADELLNLFKNDREKYEKCWDDINLFIKIGMMENEKFYERMKDALIFKNSDGVYRPLSELLPEKKEDSKEESETKLYYTSDPENQSFYMNLYKSHGKEVLTLDKVIDPHFVAFLEMKNSGIRFVRVDSEIPDGSVAEDGESGIVDPNTGKTFSESITELFTKQLQLPALKVKVEFLNDTTNPAVVTFDEAARRAHEFSAMWFKKTEEQLPAHTLVLNGKSPTIINIKKLTDKLSPDNDMIALLIWQIYDTALLAQRSISPARIDTYVGNSMLMLEKLSEKAVE